MSTALAAITLAVPADFFGGTVPGGLPAMGLMLIAGAPLYVCATASTPIAAGVFTLIVILHGLVSGTWEGKESRTQLRDGDSAERAASRVGGGGPDLRLAEQLRDLRIAAHIGDP